MTDEARELEAIRRTMATYNINGDRMRLEGLANTFMENGVLETTTARLEGRQAIREGLGGGPASPSGGKGSGRRPTVVRHNLTTSLIELTGPDTAKARTYFLVYTDIGADHMGHYIDELSKVGDEWLFAHRRVLIDWLAENTLFEGLIDAHAAQQQAKRARLAS